MSNGVYGEDLAHVGVTRKSQNTNVLLVHAELGKVSFCAESYARTATKREREGKKMERKTFALNWTDP